MYVVLYGGEKTLFMILFFPCYLFHLIPSLSLLLCYCCYCYDRTEKEERDKKSMRRDIKIKIMLLLLIIFLYTLSFLYSFCAPRPCVYRFVDIKHLLTVSIQRHSLYCHRVSSLLQIRSLNISLPSLKRNKSIYPHKFTYFFVFLFSFNVMLIGAQTNWFYVKTAEIEQKLKRVQNIFQQQIFISWPTTINFFFFPNF